MPCAIPLALREQILMLHAQQHFLSSIAKQQTVSYTSVRRLVKKFRSAAAHLTAT